MSMAVKVSTNAQRSMPGIGYQGDPGIFGTLGKIAKGIAGGVSKLGIPGISGLAGGVSGILGGILGRKTAKGNQLGRAGQGIAPGAVFDPRIITTFLPPRPQRQPVMQPGAGFRRAAERFLPGGATGMVAGGPPGAGYHLNKSDYFLKDGTFVAKGSVWVKNRRRNPLNPRALSRAMGRITSAKNASKMLGRISIRKTC